MQIQYSTSVHYVRLKFDGICLCLYMHNEQVEGLMRLMEGDHVGPFNLGNPGEFTMLELAQVDLFCLFFTYIVLARSLSYSAFVHSDAMFFNLMIRSFFSELEVVWPIDYSYTIGSPSTHSFLSH